MQKPQVKSYIFSKLKIRITFFICVIAAFTLVTLSNYNLLSTKNMLTAQNDRMNKQLEDINKKLVSSQEAIKIWNNGIASKYLSRTGLKVDLVKKRIDVIRGINNAQDLQVTVGNPESIKTLQNLQYEDLIYSTMNIRYNNFLDNESLSLINALSAQVPGIIYFTDLNITAPKENVITAVNQALSKGGMSQYKNFIVTDINIAWFDLKDKDGGAPVQPVGGGKQ